MMMESLGFLRFLRPEKEENFGFFDRISQIQTKMKFDAEKIKNFPRLGMMRKERSRKKRKKNGKIRERTNFLSEKFMLLLVSI